MKLLPNTLKSIKDPNICKRFFLWFFALRLWVIIVSSFFIVLTLWLRVQINHKFRFWVLWRFLLVFTLFFKRFIWWLFWQLFINFVILYYILGFCFTTNNNKIPVFVTNTRVTSARIGDLSALKVDFLPHGSIFLTDLFDYSNAVNFIEENFSLALTSVYIYFVVDYAATVRITGFGNIPNLITFSPLKCFVFVENAVIHVLGDLSTISQIKLQGHGRNRAIVLCWHWHFCLNSI